MSAQCLGRVLEQSAACRPREITVHVMSALKPHGCGLPTAIAARRDEKSAPAWLNASIPVSVKQKKVFPETGGGEWVRPGELMGSSGY